MDEISVGEFGVTNYEAMSIALGYSPEQMGEALGQCVRESWVFWAKNQPNQKPHWLEPWENLSREMQEVDIRIGVDLVRFWEGLKLRAQLDAIARRM